MNQLFHMQSPILVIPEKHLKARMESVKPCLINLQKDTKGFGSQSWSACQMRLRSTFILSQPALTLGRHSTIKFMKQIKTVDEETRFTGKIPT